LLNILRCHTPINFVSAKTQNFDPNELKLRIFSYYELKCLSVPKSSTLQLTLIDFLI